MGYHLKLWYQRGKVALSPVSTQLFFCFLSFLFSLSVFFACFLGFSLLISILLIKVSAADMRFLGIVRHVIHAT